MSIKIRSKSKHKQDEITTKKIDEIIYRKKVHLFIHNLKPELNDTYKQCIPSEYLYTKAEILIDWLID